MELKDVIEKIGKDKFKAAMQADDKAALDKLLDEAGVSLSEEQLDYIAGGFGVVDSFDPETDNGSCHSSPIVGTSDCDF